LSHGVTVGICAFNERMNIGKLLTNILNEQDLPVGSDVSVVCSGCTDGTEAIVQNFARRDPRVQLYVENERKGKASAVNHILSNASCDSIIFISADTLPNQGCFSRLLTTLQLSNVGIVCGKPVPINSSVSLAGRLVQVLWSFHDHVFVQLNDAGLARHATEIYCIRKGIVNRIPSEVVNDDAYVALETKKKGWLIKYEPFSQVLICGPQTIREYFQQRRRVIYGHYQVKKLTGESPQHLMYLMPVLPSRVFRLGLWLIGNQDVPTLMAFVLAEFTANIAACVDFIFRKNHSEWQTLSSTKNIVPNIC